MPCGAFSADDATRRLGARGRPRARLRRGPTCAAVVALGLALAAPPPAVSAARPAPTPRPLWNAYPLGARTETGGAATAPAASGPSDGRGVPSAQSMAAAARERPTGTATAAASPAAPWLLLAAVAAGLAAAGAVLTRRRAAPVLAATAPSSLATAPEAARDPAPATPLADVIAIDPPLVPVPVEHCRIVWWQGPAGGQFRAIGTDRRGRRYVAGRSPTVTDTRSPACDGAPLSMHRALVERLEKRGWRVESPAGPVTAEPWYAQSLSRSRPVEPPSRERVGAAGR
jgi:hypothetical protein